MIKVVWVELNDAGTPVRIFKNQKAAVAFGGEWVEKWDRSEAVQAIRRQVFRRSHGYCEFCGEIVFEDSGHLHEQQHRGKGGEISLENSVFICPVCHRRAHVERNPHFTKKP